MNDTPTDGGPRDGGPQDGGPQDRGPQASPTRGVELAGADRERALAAVAAAADAWGADWLRDGHDGSASRGGRLALPVLAGLRRGVARVRVDTWEQGAATRVTAREEERRDGLHVAAVVVLAISALGALTTVVWPFFPTLLPLAPFGALLALGGWFLVISRLQSSGPEEFLELVAKVAAAEGQE